jgi:hypothetical protein
VTPACSTKRSSDTIINHYQPILNGNQDLGWLSEDLMLRLLESPMPRLALPLAAIAAAHTTVTLGNSTRLSQANRTSENDPIMWSPSSSAHLTICHDVRLADKPRAADR